MFRAVTTDRVRTSVTASYRTPDGTVRKGLVPAPYDTATGTTVRIWIDRSGEVVEPPMTSDGAVISAFVIALILWGGATGVMALFYTLIRFLHMRIRLRWWKLEWELTAPDWTRSRSRQHASTPEPRPPCSWPRGGLS